MQQVCAAKLEARQEKFRQNNDETNVRIERAQEKKIILQDQYRERIVEDSRNRMLRKLAVTSLIP